MLYEKKNPGSRRQSELPGFEIVEYQFIVRLEQAGKQYNIQL